jgi:hypothetical protein
MTGGWQSIDIHGASYRALPPAPGARLISGSVLLLPDEDWPADEDWPELAAGFEQAGLPVVAALEFGCWWLDRSAPSDGAALTPLQRLRRDVVPWLRREWHIPEAPLAVAGIGRGGQGALQLAYRWPREFPVAAAISPVVDFHVLQPRDAVLAELFTSAEAARQQTVTLNLHPLNWPPHQWFACEPADWRFEGCERLASKLRSIGIPCEVDLATTTGGDGRAYRRRQWPQAVRFLTERLQQQSRAFE